MSSHMTFGSRLPNNSFFCISFFSSVVALCALCSSSGCASVVLISVAFVRVVYLCSLICLEAPLCFSFLGLCDLVDYIG